MVKFGYIRIFAISLALSGTSSALADVGLIRVDQNDFENVRSAVYLGAGFDYTLQNLEVSTTNAQYKGYGLKIEAGYDLGLTSDFALRIGGQYNYAELDNSVNSSTTTETLNASVFGVLAGLCWNSYVVGGGLGHSNFDVKTLSTSGISRSQKISGKLPFAFAQYSYVISPHLGGNIGIKYTNGTLSGFKYQEVSIGLTVDLLSQTR